MRILAPLTMTAAAAAAVVALAACSPAVDSAESSAGTASGSSTVRIGELASANYLSIGVTDGTLEQTLSDAGATVSFNGPFGAFAPAAEAAAAGKIDISSGSTTTLVTAASGGSDIVAFALEKYSGDSQGIVAHGDRGISSIADLAGHTVAVNKAGTGEYVLLQALASAGVDPDTVERVYLSPTDASSAFAGGQVDAIATFDQFFAAAQTIPGAQVVTTGDRIGSLNWSIHWTTRSYLDSNPALVRATYDALAATATAAADDPNLVPDTYSDLGAPADAVENIRDFDTPVIVPFDAAAVEDLETLVGQLEQFGLITSAPDIAANVVDVDTLAEPAQP